MGGNRKILQKITEEKQYSVIRNEKAVYSGLLL